MWRWPWSRRRRPIALSKRAIDFLSEQDGVPERALKGELLGVLAAEPRISAAYLARIVYEDSEAPSVALCVRAALPDPRRLVESVGAVFAKAFNHSQNLDILIMDEADEALLQNVCRPFYRRAA